jgi:putative DNA primase/helicase
MLYGKTMATASLEEIAQALGGRRSGAGYVCHCPAHDDRTPSLSLTESPEEKLLFHCHAGCPQEAVISAMRDMGLFPEGGILSSRSRTLSENKPVRGFSSPEELASWLARKTESKISRLDLYSSNFAEIRLEEPAGKTYRVAHRDKNETWKLGDPPGLLPLFRVDQLPPDPNIPILVVEGPKCVEAARNIGIHATTSAHGSKSANKTDWTPLTGRRVIIWPDNDAPGRAYAAEVRRILEGLGTTVRILDPARYGLGPGEDIADWVAAHPGELPDLEISGPGPDGAEAEAWTDRLDRTATGRLISNARTLGLILRGYPDFKGLRFNAFRCCPFFYDEPVTKPILFRIAEKIESIYGRGSTVPLTSLRDAAEAVAHERAYHPIRDWLTLLTWDGIPRIDKLFPVYFGAEDTSYIRAVAKNSLVAAVARTYKPGSKVDTMPILEGAQGAKKSSGIEELFGVGWTAVLTALPGTKEFAAGLQGKWCLEIAEMDSFSHSEVSRVKSDLSTASDWVRLSYRPDYQDLPRQCVFWGTINESEYLRDATGARRFWPVRCGEAIDLDGIRRDRDQLWAEAVRRYRVGETWWEVPEEEAREEQEARYQGDAWEGPITDWLAARPETTTGQIMTECLGIEIGRQDRSAQTRVGNVLRRIGWRRIKVRIGDAFRWIYRPPESVPASEVKTGGNNVGAYNTGGLCSHVPISKGKNTSYEISHTFPIENTKTGRNVGTGENNPVLEPCSHVVPTTTKPSRMVTKDWKEIE